ncbi:MAG: SPFH domain-containing protein [Hymenobacter sp.]
MVDIPPQAAITSDNVTIQVDAVVYFQVLDPVQAVLGVDDFRFASQRVAMTSLRSIIGRFELDDLLAHRETVNDELRIKIAQSTGAWGVEVKQRRDPRHHPAAGAAAGHGPPAEAEAERERRAKVIAATGELEASQELAEAATTLAQPQPGGAAAADPADPGRGGDREELHPDLPDPRGAARRHPEHRRPGSRSHRSGSSAGRRT